MVPAVVAVAVAVAAVAVVAVVAAAVAAAAGSAPVVGDSSGSYNAEPIPRSCSQRCSLQCSQRSWGPSVEGLRLEETPAVCFVPPSAVVASGLPVESSPLLVSVDPPLSSHQAMTALIRSDLAIVWALLVMRPYWNSGSGCWTVELVRAMASSCP